MNTSGRDVDAPAGWPDAKLLERIANEIFNGGFPVQGSPPQEPSAMTPALTAPPSVLPTSPPDPLAIDVFDSRAGLGVPGPPIDLDPLTLLSQPVEPLTGVQSYAPALPEGKAAQEPHNRHGGPVSVPGWPAESASHQPFDDGAALPNLDYPGDGTSLGDLPPFFPLALPALPQIPSIAVAGPAFYFLDKGPNAPVDYGALSTSGAPQPVRSGPRPLDISSIRQDFPILNERVNGGRQLVWLDNAATTQKPRAVIDRLTAFYEHENSNIHRAAHELAARATDAYEAARQKIQRFLNAGSSNEIVFVRGATEAINLVAQSWGRQNIGKDDEIVVSWLEHHANIVPWQQLVEVTGARLRVIPVDDDGQIILSEYAKLLGPRTKLVSIAHVSNALGTIVPVTTVAAMAHAVGAKVLVDGAQAVSHMPVNVQAIDADWYVFSGHKVFGPTGIGVVYGKEGLLNLSQPWQGGGNMIADVTFERTVYHKAPARFEAGTGNIADAVGLGAAIDYVTQLGMESISQYEHQLLLYATRLLKEIPGLRLIGTAPDKASVLSFVIDGHNTADIGKALSQEGIAVRSGHHCAQPILRRFGVEATVRPSLAFYNNCADIDALISVLTRLTSSKSPVPLS